MEKLVNSSWLIWIGIWQLADLFIHTNDFAGPFVNMAVTLAGLLKRWGFLAKSVPLRPFVVARSGFLFGRFSLVSFLEALAGLSSGKAL